MADEEDIDQLAAEAVQAFRRYMTAAIIQEFNRQHPPEGKED
jgi:hypothetical protein